MYDKEAHLRAANRAVLVQDMIAPLKAGQPKTIFRDKTPDDIPFGEPAVFLERRCHTVALDALAPFLNIDIDRLAYMSNITEGIGAGFSGMGEVCGAVSGAIMACGIDLASRYHDTVILRLLVSIATQKFMQSVIKEFGSVRCRDIIGHNLSHFLEPGDTKWKGFTMDEDAVRRCGAIQHFAIMNPLPYEEEDYLDIAYGDALLKK